MDKISIETQKARNRANKEAVQGMEHPRGLFLDISIRVSIMIITEQPEKSKTGNGARMAEFRDVRPLSAFLR